MTVIEDRRCAVCGRPCHGDRCRKCFTAGRRAPVLWCDCKRPDPVSVRVFGSCPVEDAVECRRCGRRVL